MVEFNFTLSYLQIYFIGINFLGFILYGFDKVKALKDTSRVSELNLLFIALVGGSIGALVSMVLFRHKIKKLSFMFKYAIVVIIQIVSIYYIKM